METKRKKGNNSKLRRDVAHILRGTDDNDDGYVEASLAERFGMMWDITWDVWAFGGTGDVERRLQRDVTAFVRRTG